MTPYRAAAAILILAALVLPACLGTESPRPATPSPLAAVPPAPTTMPNPLPGPGTPQIQPPPPAVTTTPNPPPAPGTPQAQPTVAQPSSGVRDTPIALRTVASGLAQPVYVTYPPDGSGDLFVVEKAGRIQIVRNGAVAGTLLDIRDRVNNGGSEQGLLGLAIHPNYRSNGYLYVYYIAGSGSGQTVVARFTANADRRTANPSSEQRVLAFAQPFANHNGGMIDFGPDGMLWIGTGDGGSQADPQGNGQRLDTLLGKLLRLDIDAGAPYAIPADNPFASRSGARPEIWALGLRNPWRFSFDRQTNDLYIGDVGQNAFEETSFLGAPLAPQAGANFGWRLREGNACFPIGTQSCTSDGLVAPIDTYANPGLGCSITGGYVYRGRQFPALQGNYYFTDYCSGRIWSLRRDAAGAWQRSELFDGPLGFASFGEDEAGELYITNVSNGQLLQLTQAR